MVEILPQWVKYILIRKYYFSDIKCKSGEVQCSDGKCAVVGDAKKECDGADENCPDCPECRACPGRLTY